jgi:hypothetical protein
MDSNLKKIFFSVVILIAVLLGLAMTGFISVPHKCVDFSGIEEVPPGDWCNSIFERPYWEQSTGPIETKWKRVQ